MNFLNELNAKAKETPIKYAEWRTDKPKEDGYSHELVSVDCEKFLNGASLDELEVYIDGVDTLYKGLKKTVERIPDEGVLGTRVGDKYEWMSFKEFDKTCEDLSYGIKAKGLTPEVEAEGKTWKFMGIQSKNRKEWQLVSVAGMYQGVTTVGFYETLGQYAQRFICNQTDLATIACSADQIVKIAKLKIEDMQNDGKMAKLVNLLVFEDASFITDEQKELCETAQITMHHFNDLVQLGANLRAEGNVEVVEPNKEDIYMLSYTSGTTGDPKGVKFSHKMLVMNANGSRSQESKELGEQDSYLSYLPASHSFEQAIFARCLLDGVKCGFYCGDVLKLMEDIAILKPTAMGMVPKILTRLYAGISAKFAAHPAAEMVNKAIGEKLENYKNFKGVAHPAYDEQIFKPIRAILGGRVRLMGVGSAPIAADVLDYLSVVFSCEINEGYGMTETAAGASVMKPSDPMSGIVGGPLPMIKIRLRDVPEMNYFNTNEIPTGEVVFFGPTVTTGYFKAPEKTDEVRTADGWLHSGDVAAVLPNGTLRIIDRVKNIFKLSTGEYVAPEKLEQVYGQNPYTTQLFLHGDSLRDHCIMFVVLEPTTAVKLAETMQIQDLATAITDPAFIQKMFDDLMALADANNFQKIERPRQIKLLLEPFTIEQDLVTPTMKLKRAKVKQFLESEIAALYEQPFMQVTPKE